MAPTTWMIKTNPGIPQDKNILSQSPNSAWWKTPCITKLSCTDLWNWQMQRKHIYKYNFETLFVKYFG